MGLPPGQRERDDFPRFGLTPYADRIIDAPEELSLRLVGADGERVLGRGELEALPRVERVSDFHCVTTWSVCGLRWSGWSLADVLGPTDQSDDKMVVVSALDGFRARLPLADALHKSVLLADRLNGEPLCRNHGAPLRLVAPRHYGFKNVKHVKSIRVCRRGEENLKFAGFKWMEHPRGRVDLEERGGLPGRFLRYLYRPMIGRTVRIFRDAMAHHERKSRR